MLTLDSLWAYLCLHNVLPNNMFLERNVQKHKNNKALQEVTL